MRSTTSVVTGALGLSATEIEGVLEVASLAPSVHNSQPWRFRVLPNRIELHIDPERRLPAIDPEDRELRLSCGAVLLNLKLALQGYGVRPLVTLLPAGGEAADDGSAALAVVRHGGQARRTSELGRLLQAVRARRTNRSSFINVSVPLTHRVLLVRAVQSERGWLHLVSERGQRSGLRDLVLRAHREQMADPGYVAELLAWTAYDCVDRDGAPVAAWGAGPKSRDEWLWRDFTAARGRTRVVGKDFESDPLLVVLCSCYEGPLAELQAGQALQRLLLTATALGLSASFLSPPIEVPHIRAELCGTLGTTLSPQAVLRIGFGTLGRPTPRRPVAELLMRHKERS